MYCQKKQKLSAYRFFMGETGLTLTYVRAICSCILLHHAGLWVDSVYYFMVAPALNYFSCKCQKL